LLTDGIGLTGAEPVGEASELKRLLADFIVRLLSDSVLPKSRVPLHVGHRNDGNASLSLCKKHSAGKTPR
jgi:hypothetical protein